MRLTVSPSVPTVRGSSLLLFLLVSGLLAPATAFAQQVRVTRDAAEVRLDPSDSSPVITTLSTGTVLEWIGE